MDFFPSTLFCCITPAEGGVLKSRGECQLCWLIFFFFHQPHPEIKRLTDKITMTWNNSKANRSTAVALVMFHVFAILLWQGRKYFQRNSWKLMPIKHLNDSVTFPGVWRLGFLFPFLCEILHRRQKHTAEAVSGEVALSCTVRKAYISCL